MDDKMNERFTLCMSVYRNDNPVDFLTAYLSVTSRQVHQPAEAILVVDGPIPSALNDAVLQMEKESCVPLSVIRLTENGGHAVARQTAIDAAQCPLVAIMDSDDIAVPERFSKQIEYFMSHPEADVVGGQITEFIGDTSNIVGVRIVPTTDSAIKKYLKSRCPMNFMTVMVRKEALAHVGGIKDWYCEEDYYLWIRMVLQQCVFANLPDVLVNVRSGNDMYRRRGGWRYFKSERGIQRLMLTNHLISPLRYCYNVIGRFVVQIAMPNWLRGLVYRVLFRQNNENA